MRLFQPFRTKWTWYLSLYHVVEIVEVYESNLISIFSAIFCLHFTYMDFINCLLPMKKLQYCYEVCQLSFPSLSLLILWLISNFCDSVTTLPPLSFAILVVVFPFLFIGLGLTIQETFHLSLSYILGILNLFYLPKFWIWDKLMSYSI